MNIRETANELLSKYGLKNKGWQFKFNKSVRTIGLCNQTKKTIEISEYYTHVDEFELMDTLLHEIAHALVGVHNGHNIVWKQMAKQLGAKPTSCTNLGPSNKPSPYSLYCSKCWSLTPIYKTLTREHSCKKCWPSGYNPDFKLDVITNILYDQEKKKFARLMAKDLSDIL